MPVAVEARRRRVGGNKRTFAVASRWYRRPRGRRRVGATHASPIGAMGPDDTFGQGLPSWVHRPAARTMNWCRAARDGGAPTMDWCGAAGDAGAARALARWWRRHTLPPLSPLAAAASCDRPEPGPHLVRWHPRADFGTRPYPGCTLIPLAGDDGDLRRVAPMRRAARGSHRSSAAFRS